MPYYRHKKDEEPRLGAMHRSKAMALKKFDKSTEIITFVASAAEREAWQMRERGRMNDGTYTNLPWRTDPQNYLADQYPNHFAHLNAEGLVAFTPDDEHGHSDRQTVMSPGKYLQKYYVSVGYMSATNVPKFVAMCDASYSKFHVTRDKDEIVAVYRVSGGPRSCMSVPLSEFAYHKSFPCHPVSLYADSDLSLAYIGDLKNKIVSARALIWEEKKVFGRLYGHIELLKSMLEKAGYTFFKNHNAFAGASLPLVPINVPEIRDGDAFLLPYIDGHKWGTLDEDKKRIFISNDRFESVNRNDVIMIQNGGSGYVVKTYFCELGCGRYVKGKNRKDEMPYCDNCAAYVVECNMCAKTFSRNKQYGWKWLNPNQTEVACKDCVVKHSAKCIGCGERYFEQGYSELRRARRAESGKQGVCVNCESLYTACKEHQELYFSNGHLAGCPKCPPKAINESAKHYTDKKGIIPNADECMCQNCETRRFHASMNGTSASTSWTVHSTNSTSTW